MTITNDVLVIGGGIAACTTAPLAVGTDARVRLLAHKKSTFRQTSDLVNVLGYVGGDGPLSGPYAGLDVFPEGHPYHVVSEDGVRADLRILDRAVGNTYRGGHMDSDVFVMAHDGAVKPAARYPTSAVPGLASSSGDTLLIGFAGLTDFDASIVTNHLTTVSVPFSVRGVTVEFPKRFRADTKVTRFAKAPDRGKDVDGGAVCSVLADIIAKKLDDKPRVDFPAMLGDDHDEDARTELSNQLGIPIFEMSTGPSSLFGLKLEDILFDALDETGVRISAGSPAVDFEADTGRVGTIVIDQKNRPTSYSADQIVLTTGGLVGRGFDPDRESVTEPVFGCRVPHPEDRYDRSSPETFGDRAFTHFGVVPGDELRSTDEDGGPYFENLRVAGGVVGNVDAAHKKSASSISLTIDAATGQLVDEEAAR